MDVCMQGSYMRDHARSQCWGMMENCIFLRRVTVWIQQMEKFVMQIGHQRRWKYSSSFCAQEWGNKHDFSKIKKCSSGPQSRRSFSSFYVWASHPRSTLYDVRTINDMCITFYMESSKRIQECGKSFVQNTHTLFTPLFWMPLNIQKQHLNHININIAE